MSDIYIIDAKRTAIGNFNGSFSGLEAHELGAKVIKNLMSSNNIPAEAVSEVIMGQVLTAGLGMNPARQAAIAAGLPIEVPAYNVSHVCGSGLKAVALGMQAIKNGDSSIVIAGGQENMTRARHAMFARAGIKLGNGIMVDTMMHDGLTDVFDKVPMGITAENIAEEFKISREDQDIFAYNSQMKAKAAVKADKFEDEIVPVTIQQRREDVMVKLDEFIKPDTSLEKLASLRPAFKKDGSVTAANASGINDGAAAIMLANAEMVEKYNLKPMAKIKAYAQAGVEPRIMGIGPVEAVKKVLEKSNWQIKDLDLIEANEAFAVQAIAVNQQLKWDETKVNVNGGAIALGHPIGASGARVLTSLVHEMKRSKAEKGLATLCIGGGMGIAMTIENL